MGISVPNPDDPGPQTGWSCPYFGLGYMQNIYLTLCGVRWVGMGPNDNPFNKTYLLPPSAICAWTKIIDLGGVDQLSIGVSFSENRSDVVVMFLPSRLQYYHFEYTGIITKGINQAVYPWTGGTHEITTQYHGTPGALSDLALAVGISTKQKTFAEPAGVGPDGLTSNVRLARQYDGTNVYIKMP